MYSLHMPHTSSAVLRPEGLHPTTKGHPQQKIIKISNQNDFEN